MQWKHAPKDVSDNNKISNFEYFTSQFQLQDLPISIIALAETNTGKEEGDIYRLENYSHFYGNKFPDKHKGTGVCLYVHETLNAMINESLCTVTKNLESLFVSVSFNNISLNIGVIYRPPSGD